MKNKIYAELCDIKIKLQRIEYEEIYTELINLISSGKEASIREYHKELCAQYPKVSKDIIKSIIIDTIL